MEGRLALNISLSEFETTTGLKVSAASVIDFFKEPKYNICPADYLPVETNRKDFGISLFKWGLIPGWTSTSKKTKGLTCISANSINTKPVLQQAFNDKRCLVWCTGFYLWKDSPAGKIPFYITLKTRSIFCVAGMWESWEDDASNTFCMVTKESAGVLPSSTTEVPVLLDSSMRSKWLNDSSAAMKILNSPVAYSEDLFDIYPVNRKIIKSTDNEAKFVQKVNYLVAEQTSMFS